MKLLSAILLVSTIALGQTKDAPPRIGDALRCENGKCVSKQSTPVDDGPVIVQLLETIREQDERIVELEKRCGKIMPERSHAVSTVTRKK